MKTISFFIFAAVLVLQPVIVLAQKAPTPVFVTVVKRQPFVDEVEALGTLQANENVELTSTVTELVTKVNFKDGQRVSKGDILVEMDIAEEIALKAEEQFRINEAQRQVDRLKPLTARGASSKSTLDRAVMELQTAQARMKALDSRIQQRQIVAPFNGVLGLRNISIGALVQPGTVITTHDDDSIMKLDFSVPEVFLPALQAGAIIEATANPYPEEIFTGKIGSVNSRIDPVTRAIAVRALIENPEHKLKPGLLMRVKLMKNPRQTLIVPEEALIVQGDKKFVFVIQDDVNATTVRRTEIETGMRRRGEIEVLSGLKEGDQIVIHGTLRVRDGSIVVISAQDTGAESLQALLQQNITGENKGE